MIHFSTRSCRYHLCLIVFCVTLGELSLVRLQHVNMLFKAKSGPFIVCSTRFVLPSILPSFCAPSLATSPKTPFSGLQGLRAIGQGLQRRGSREDPLHAGAALSAKARPARLSSSSSSSRQRLYSTSITTTPPYRGNSYYSMLHLMRRGRCPSYASIELRTYDHI